MGGGGTRGETAGEEQDDVEEPEQGQKAGATSHGEALRVERKYVVEGDDEERPHDPATVQVAAGGLCSVAAVATQEQVSW